MSHSGFVSSNSTTLWLPFLQAKSSAVFSSLSMALQSVCVFRRRLSTAAWLYLDAICNGVRPFSSTAEIEQGSFGDLLVCYFFHTIPGNIVPTVYVLEILACVGIAKVNLAVLDNEDPTSSSSLVTSWETSKSISPVPWDRVSS